MSRPEPASSRIAALASEIEAGNEAALEAFWALLDREGTPIVEDTDEGDFRAVTFVWRDADEDTRRVDLEGGPASSQKDADRLLSRLPGSDVWFKTYRVRSDMRAHYEFSRNGPDQDAAHDVDDGAWPVSTADPLNPNRFTWPGSHGDPAGRDSEYSVVTLPGAPADAWADPRPGIHGGRVEQHVFRSDLLDNERRVWTYHPAATDDRRPPAVMVLLDGWEWSTALPIAPTLDNLIAMGEIPPIVVVMPESLGHVVRSLELPCHEPFVGFLAEELLPWVRERWEVTADPVRTIAAGQSYGGLAAAFAGLRRPDVFGNVISQSGSFWWKAGSEFDIEAEWLTRRFATEPAVPVRLWLEVGLLEGDDMLAANRHLRNVLEAKGYDVTYQEFNHDHWWPSWRGSLGEALRSITHGLF